MGSHFQLAFDRAAFAAASDPSPTLTNTIEDFSFTQPDRLYLRTIILLLVKQ